MLREMYIQMKPGEREKISEEKDAKWLRVTVNVRSL